MKYIPKPLCRADCCMKSDGLKEQGGKLYCPLHHPDANQPQRRFFPAVDVESADLQEAIKYARCCRENPRCIVQFVDGTFFDVAHPRATEGTYARTIAVIDVGGELTFTDDLARRYAYDEPKRPDRAGPGFGSALLGAALGMAPSIGRGRR